MLVANFINAVSTIYKVNTLMVCLNYDILEDTDLAEWVDKLSNKNFDDLYFSTSIFPINPTNDKQVLVYSPSQCYVNLLSLLGIKSNIVWLVSEQHVNNFPENLRLDSNFVTFMGHDDGLVFLKENYRVKGGPVVSNDLGVWSQKLGMKIHQPDFWKRRSNFDGMQIIGTAMPWLQLIQTRPGHFIPRGPMGSMLLQMQNMVNFTVIPTMPRQPQYGIIKRSANGTISWTGMVGQLFRREADVAFNGMSATPERDQFIDFGIGVDMPPITLMISKMALSTGDINMMAYLSVLTVDVWYSALGHCIVFALSYTYIRSFYRKEKQVTSFGCGLASYGQAYLLLSSPLEGSHHLSYKFLAMSMIVVGFVVYTNYVANLTAEMTVRGGQKSIRSFQDVLDNKLNVFITKGGVTEAFFVNAPVDSAISKAYQGGTTSFFAVSRRTIGKFRKVLLDNPKNSYFGNQVGSFDQDPDIVTIDSFRDNIPVSLAMAFQEDSEIRPIFNYYINKMRETGVVSRLWNRYIKYDVPKDNTERIFNDEANPLGYDNLFFPALVLILGLLGAWVIIVVEIVLKPKKFFGSDVKMTSLSKLPDRSIFSASYWST